MAMGRRMVALLAACLSWTIAGCQSTSDAQVQVSALKGATARSFSAALRSSLSSEFESARPDELTVCSFNVSFAGHWRAREKKSRELASYLEPCDVIAIQELVAPPTNIGLDQSGHVYHWLDQKALLASAVKKDRKELIEEFTPWWPANHRPTGVKIVKEWKPDYQAHHFVGHMQKVGFDYVISVGDTGKTSIDNNSTASEWHIVFYRPKKVQPAPRDDMPTGWVMLEQHEPRRAHPVFDRVPYAFGFRTVPQSDGTQLDFVLINVHLHATQHKKKETEAEAGFVRVKELARIHQWIEAMHAKYAERDYIIIGDMNFADREQFTEMVRSVSMQIKEDIRPQVATLVPLNAEQLATNISELGPKPYDQVLINPHHSQEVIRSEAYGADLIVGDLTAQFPMTRRSSKDTRNYVKAYSDHLPILFVMRIGKDDD